MLLALARLIVSTGAAGVLCFGQWPTPRSAMEAYDFVQGRRDQAQVLWERGDQRGIRLLQEVLPYLDQPLVRDLAAGDEHLAARRVNIYLDLAEAHAMGGNRAECLAQLRKVLAAAPDPSVATFLESRKPFLALQTNPEFQQLLSGFRRFARFWDSDALSTKFTQNLSDTEKLAGLGKFWSEIKYNFGYPEKLVALDWDKLYLQWIPKVLATKSTEGYYRELMRLCALLQDGHTNVYTPEEIDDSAKPPLRTELVEGHVMILEVMSPALESQGVRPGMEIVAVDGEAPAAYAAREIAPFQSASTPQNLALRTYGYGLLRGPGNKPVRLKLRDADRKDTEKTLPRQGYTDTKARPVFAWQLLRGNVAHVALNSFENDDAVQQWKASFPEIRQASALILDLRMNGGGSSSVGFEILRYLVSEPFLTSRQTMRSYNPTQRARGTFMNWLEVPAEQVQPQPQDRYTGPVVVLTGPATFSAAEDFLVAWKNSRRGKVIGEPSGGSTGQPLFFKLPGNGQARVCTKRDTYPDGQEWVGIGIQPDIAVSRTLRDAQTGRDTVLEQAIGYLRRVP